MSKSTDLITSTNDLPSAIPYVVQRVKEGDHPLTFNLKITEDTLANKREAYAILKEWQIAVETIGNIYGLPNTAQQLIISTFWNKIPEERLVDNIQQNENTARVVYSFVEEEYPQIESTSQISHDSNKDDLLS